MPFQHIDPTAAIAITGVSQSGPATSGWLSFAQLQAELRLRLGGRSDIDASRVKLWINEAYTDICNALDLAKLRASVDHILTIDETVYSLPADTRMVIAITYNDPTDTMYGGLVEKIDVEEYRRLPEEYSTGRPLVWTPYLPEVIVFYPSPDRAYPVTLDCKLRPTRMTADGDYPLLADEYIEPLLLLSRAKAFSALLEFSLSGQCMNEYVALMRSRRNEVAEQAEGSVGRMVPVRTQRQLLRSKRRIYGVCTDDD